MRFTPLSSYFSPHILYLRCLSLRLLCKESSQQNYPSKLSFLNRKHLFFTQRCNPLCKEVAKASRIWMRWFRPRVRLMVVWPPTPFSCSKEDVRSSGTSQNRHALFTVCFIAHRMLLMPNSGADKSLISDTDTVVFVHPSAVPVSIIIKWHHTGGMPLSWLWSLVYHSRVVLLHKSSFTPIRPNVQSLETTGPLMLVCSPQMVVHFFWVSAYAQNISWRQVCRMNLTNIQSLSSVLLSRCF